MLFITFALKNNENDSESVNVAQEVMGRSGSRLPKVQLPA